MVRHPLFSGSAIMIFGSNLANLIAYIYHLVIGRMLGPANYGVLAAVLSLMGLVLTAFSFLNIVVVKFVSASDENKRVALFSWFSQRIFWMGVALSFLMFGLSGVLSEFLHIERTILVILSPVFFLMVFIVFHRAFLQGIFKFGQLVISINLEMLGRLVLGVGALILGLSVRGAVLGIAISAGVAYLLLKNMLKDYSRKKIKKSFEGEKEVFAYALPVVISTVAIYSLFTTDVLLVKHFFSEHDAGIYASLSTIGKIIFYATAPVASVMFPLISQRTEKGLGYKKIFLLSFLFTAGISLGVIFLYWLVPNLMVGVLFGEKFAETGSYLFSMGIFMGIFALCSLMVSFFLSRNKTAAIYLTPIAAVIQIVGIWFIHESLVDVIKVNIFASSALLITLLLYFGYENRSA